MKPTLTTRFWGGVAARAWAWFARCWAFFLSVPDRARTAWAVRKAPELMAPGAAALKKVYAALPKVPPDTITAGIQNGGHALFFRHDEAMEICIGRDYDHAADQLIKWYREEEKAEVAPTTRETTKMPRKERRATSSALRKKKKPKKLKKKR